MLDARYEVVRARLIELYNILSFQTYPVWIAPETLMTTEQLRGRYEQRNEGFANDVNYFTEPQLRELRIPKLMGMLENIDSHEKLGFSNANRVVVEIYESIQEYLSLWCEIIRTNCWRYPPMEELRKLENIAYLIYPKYKVIKPFKVNQEIREKYRDDAMHNAQGLMGMGALFMMHRMGTGKGEEDYSFVSHLDDLNSAPEFLPSTNYQQNQAPGWFNHAPASTSPMGDSLLSPEVKGGNPDWLFDGGDR